MNSLSLIFAEMRHRPTAVIVALLATAIAVATMLLCLAGLRSFQLETERLADQVAEETNAEVEKMNNQIRKSMKGLGFNIFIYPEQQELADVYEQGFASETMPEEYVSRLAASKIVTVNHLLPRLTRRIDWEAANRSIMLIGVRGEVPFLHKDPKKPLIDPVEAGHVVLGYALWQPQGLKVGDEITLKDKSFKISACHDERGTVDDITAWVNLGEAQEMLELPKQITSILALQCNCASMDRLGEVREEVTRILPGARIIEKGSRALARAEARNIVQLDGKKRLENLVTQRAERRQDRESVIALLLPLVSLCSAGWVAFLAWNNVRQRRSEIGTLRAMGVRGYQVMTIFLGKALLIGLLGVAMGLLLALFVTGATRESWFGGYSASQLVSKQTWLAFAVVTPLVSVVASWMPAVLAASADPVEVLRGE